MADFSDGDDGINRDDALAFGELEVRHGDAVEIEDGDPDDDDGDADWYRNFRRVEGDAVVENNHAGVEEVSDLLRDAREVPRGEHAWADNNDAPIEIDDVDQNNGRTWEQLLRK